MTTRVISAILGATLLTLLYYAGLVAVQKRFEINRRGRSAIAVAIITFGGWCAVGMQEWLYTDIEMYALSFLLVLAMAVICVIDWQRQLIPNLIIRIMLLVWGVVVAVGVFVDLEQGAIIIASGIVSALFAGIVFLLCYLISHKQVGAGDVKLVFVMGLYLTGERIMGAIFYGVLLCCVYSIIQLLRKKIGLKDGVPMTPFLYLGTLVVLAML